MMLEDVGHFLPDLAEVDFLSTIRLNHFFLFRRTSKFVKSARNMNVVLLDSQQGLQYRCLSEKSLLSLKMYNCALQGRLFRLMMRSSGFRSEPAHVTFTSASLAS